MSAVVRMTTGAGVLWRWVLAMPLRIRLARREAQEIAQPVRGLSVQERQADLIRFYGHYECLVEVLCDAAQLGPVEKLERAYQRERSWMLNHYPLMRRYVLAYLRLDPIDAAQSSRLDGTYGDAFEALFAAPNLVAFLEVDDGNMISRILRTREAVNHYGEHLRQLLAREKTCA